MKYLKSLSSSHCDGKWQGKICVKWLLSSVLFLLVMFFSVYQIQSLQRRGLSMEKRQVLDIASPAASECEESNADDDVCLSPSCVHAASRIMKAMDTSVDPCTDFYKYACNGWIRTNEHKINEEQVFYATNLNEVPQKVNLELERLLNGQLPIGEEIRSSKAYKDLLSFYQSCKHQETSSDMEALDLLQELEYFQVGAVFDSSKWDLTKAVLELLRVNGVPLFDILIDTDIKQTDKVSIDITLPRQYGLMPSSSLFGPAKRRSKLGMKFLKRYIKTGLFSDMEEDIRILELSTEKQSNGISDSPDAINTYKAKEVDNHFTVEGITDQNHSTKSSANNIQPHGDNHFKISVPDEHQNASDSDSITPVTSKSNKTTVTEKTTETSQTYDAPAIAASAETIKSISHQIQSSTVPTSIMADHQGNLTESNYRNESPPLQFLSRRNVYKIFKSNLDYKRRSEISALILKGELSNSSYILRPPQIIKDLHFENDLSFILEDNINMTDEDPAMSDQDAALYHMIAAIEDFITKLDQMRPSANDEILFRLHLKMYNKITLTDLQEQYPMLDWNYFLRELFNATITDDDIIYVHYPAYLKQLNELVLNSEPWVVHHSMLALYVHDVLEEAVNPESESRKKEFCLTATKTAFGDAMSNLYLNHVGKKRIQEVRHFSRHLLNNIVAVVENAVNSSNWYTEKDKTEALNKLQNTVAEVGAHDDYWNITFINQLHKRVDMSPLSFFGKVISLYRSFREEYYTYYQQPLPKQMLIWGLIIQPYVVNAFHLQTYNTIVFPEAFFNEPYYTSQVPNYINYGSAGEAMAHELFHGLDYTGSLFNHEGLLNRPFSNSSRAHLAKQVNCFHQLLDHSLTQNIMLDGTTITMEIDKHITINEILADVSGLWAAYEAYKRYETIYGSEPLLPALNLTAHQTFFVAAAQPYCAVIHDLAKIFLMEVDEHLVNDMRINSLIMNSREFAEVFQCSSDSRMVAQQKCQIFS